MNNKIFDYISLHYKEEEREKVLENVKSNISFRGSNLWILACAIVVASVGLNVNSTAVIIGAMLISPLMGPIVGAGFALAIYDFELLKKSGKNIAIATLVSLLVAAIYFFISPFKETQSELLARTSPNIYDVLIAFFGGLVGVIAITRVEKGNPIPGVAIATALMPPLCTAGYGLAIGNFSYFFGAFYLYVINCFFICIATFLIIKYLKYKPVKFLNEKVEKQIKYGITTLMLIMIIPSFYLAYSLFNEKKYTQKVEQFIENEFLMDGYTIVYKKINFNSNPKKIELAFLAKHLNENEVILLNNKLIENGITNTELIIKQDIRDLKTEILNEINSEKNIVTKKNIEIESLKRELYEYKTIDETVFNEIKILFPEIKDISLGKHVINYGTDSSRLTTVFVYNTQNVNTDTEKLKNWLSQKLDDKTIILVKKEAR